LGLLAVSVASISLLSCCSGSGASHSISRNPTESPAAQAIAAELAEAEHALLRAETGVEYAQALVTYNKNRVKRLKAYQTPVETA